VRRDRGGVLNAVLSRRCLLAAAATLAAGRARAEDAAVRVASKADVEGVLLGSLILRSLHAGGVPVEDHLGLGGTRIARAALIAGEIDLYPEYTGNGAIFFHQENEPIWRDRLGGWARIRILDRSRNHLVWLPAAPADNGWAIAMRSAMAATEGLRTMTDFARWVNGGAPVRLAASAEFVESPAALPTFEAAYEFHLDSGLIVVLAGGNTAATLRATAEGISGVNAGMAYGTDGAIDALHLVTLADDQHAQVVFAPAPVVRQDVLDAHPTIAPLLAPVFARLDVATLRHLNARIAVDGAAPDAVALDWLRAEGLPA
jgi:osmoprotectant transport system substrate-binding protein